MIILMKMKISEVIERNYKYLQGFLKRRDIVLGRHQTSDDVFQNVMVMALNKYKERDVDESEGLSYLRKSLAMELKFQYKKIDNKELYIEDTDCPLECFLYISEDYE